MLHPLEDAFVNPAFIPRLATFKNGFGVTGRLEASQLPKTSAVDSAPGRTPSVASPREQAIRQPYPLAPPKCLRRRGQGENPVWLSHQPLDPPRRFRYHLRGSGERSVCGTAREPIHDWLGTQ